MSPAILPGATSPSAATSETKKLEDLRGVAHPGGRLFDGVVLVLLAILALIPGHLLHAAHLADGLYAPLVP